MTTARDLAYAALTEHGGWHRAHFEYALDVYDEKRAKEDADG
jgi:hypothetical protein